MSEIQSYNQYPLSIIFKTNKEGEIIEELSSVKSIPLFFEVLSSEEIADKEKIKFIEILKQIINKKSYIIEYFSSYNSKSIYLFFFELFLSPSTTPQLKSTILSFFEELIINVETAREIYEFLFQKLSLLYRDKDADSEKLNNFLNLLNKIMGSTENIEKPRNYFCCSGNGRFEVDLSNENITMGKYLTFIVNFKISGTIESEKIQQNKEVVSITDLIKIKFSSGISYTIELQNQLNLKIKESNTFIKVYNPNEWINLVICIYKKDNKLDFYFFSNGENSFKRNQLITNLTSDDTFDSIIFFDNFYGEVSSMSMAITREGNVWSLSNNFLKWFSNYKEGLWKKKYADHFFKMLNELVPSIPTFIKNKTGYFKKSDINETPGENDPKINYIKNFIFIYTPFNLMKDSQGEVESSVGNIKLTYNGNIRSHRYQCYQKKLAFVNGIANLMPIAEMFLIRPETLNKENLQIFLNIIINIINGRKLNIEELKKCNFFQVLSLFVERYPKNLFNEKILENFVNLGKTICANDDEALLSSYFEYIFLNEKIISKYSENLQIKFWQQVLLFCQTDKEQISTFMNMNRICLILRFYDKNKYSEMCCEKHLLQIKEKYIGNMTVMNPTMEKKLSYLREILQLVITSLDSANNVISLYKLLTLDLSPCLTKFILNVFSKALNDKNCGTEWKKSFMQELINNKYDVIAINTFIHSLPDVRYDLLKLMFEIHTKLNINFTNFEKMIKSCLLPQKMFYATEKESNTLMNNNEKYKSQENNNDIIENKNCDKNENNDIKEDNNIKEENNENDIIEDNKNINEEKDNENKLEEEKNNNEENGETEEEKNNNEENGETEEDTEKELVIKDEFYIEYKDKLFKTFLLWSLGINIDMEINMDSLTNMKIEYLDILEIIFFLDDEIKDLNLTLKFMESMKKLIFLDYNCYIILLNKKIYAYFLDLTFKYLNSSNELDNKIYNTGREILIGIFSNSINFIEKNKLEKYPCYELKTMFLWGQEIIKSNRNYNNVLDFLNSVLNIIILQLEKYESKTNFNLTSDIKSNFYLKNYLILNTQLFAFSFHFQDFYNTLDDINLKKKIMEKYTSSMQLDLSKNKITDIWLNFPFFNKIYNRINYLWQKENIVKKFKMTMQKGNKLIKYENILQKLILDKNNKNVYLSELLFLTYEEKNNDSTLIIPLIQTITLTLMSIISILVKIGNNEKELRYWLKELKKYILFLIISSTNLTRNNQLEIYNNIQSKVIGPIIASICFLKDMTSTSKFCKDKIKNTLHSILLFCFLITKYEHQYIIKHKSGIKIFNIMKKKARNDLKMSAVYIIFNDTIKDKTGNTLLPLTLFEKLNMNQYINIVNLLDTKEWEEALYNNQTIKSKILNDLFTFDSFKDLKDTSMDLIIINNNEKKFTEEILYLLPLYEKELSKYSNNSLENTIQKKNRYKYIKKRAFSWNGLWSDRKLFFETPQKLKYKIINHYTKTLMKPLLSPILDIEYYLPEFTDFKLENLFTDNDGGGYFDKNKFKITMDIDKILKLSEQNQISLYNSMRESFDETKKRIKENYLRKIYLKSNPKLAESLKKISNNLDLGKEDEFTKLEYSENDTTPTDKKQKRYFLACLVKTSHHIKGVCFIDENQLNFKVFLNQRTGNSMSGVELAFTNKDDDYDINRQTCFGSYFICHPKDKDLYQISINYKDIKWLFRRRYYYKNSGIEIFTTANKSFYLNFKFEEDREYVIKEIIEKIEDISLIYDDLKDPKDNFENIIGFENSNVIFGNKKKNKKIKLSKKIELWKDWKISNFEFLAWMNIYGNRSYNDISQYPVFPWVLGSYEDPLKTKQKNLPKKQKMKKKNSIASYNINEESESEDEDLDWETLDDNDTEIDYTYRDMSQPMGMLELNKEGIKRKELFIEMYETLKNDPEIQKPFLFGSNYSNPMYVCNFMMRLFPFSHIAIELQGNKFDQPDRLFYSVKNSFFNSLTQKTDVRELIPEFFYFPEIFININKLNFGTREDGNIVDNIITPCDNNPFSFVMTMKTVLENERTSKVLQKWVDLIFGYKARGKEAELAYNIFSDKSYQESINLNNEENKEATLRRVEFGLIPTQILNKRCRKRTKKSTVLKGLEVFDSSACLTYNKCRKHFDNISIKHSKEKKDKDKKEKEKEKELIEKTENKEDTFVLCVGCFSTEKLFIYLSNNSFQERKITCPVFDKIYTDELLNKIKLQNQYNKMSEFYSSDSTNRKAICFSKQGKIIILGGFFDGKVVLMGTDGKGDSVIMPFKDESPVLSIITDKNDEFIFMGNAIGNVCIYKNIEGRKYKNEFLLTDQKSAISHMFYSNILNVLATASIDGYICIYTLPLCKLIRCFKIPTTNTCNYVILSDSPLPVVMVVCEGEGEKDVIYVYSINGSEYLCREVNFKISNPILVKSINSNDYFACIGDENIYILSIPDLIIHVSVEKEFNAYSMCFNEDNRLLYVLDKKGNEIMVIKGEKEKQKVLRSATFIKK